jgi:hypothetical protein
MAGRKPKLKEPHPVLVTIEKRQDDFIKLKGINLSELTRKTIDTLIEREGSSKEELRRKIEENKEKQESLQIEYSLLNEGYMQLEAQEMKELHEKKKEIEIETKRQNIFEQRYSKSIRRIVIADISFYQEARKELEFKTDKELLDFLEKNYLEIGYDESRIKEFLKKGRR